MTVTPPLHTLEQRPLPQHYRHGSKHPTGLNQPYTQTRDGVIRNGAVIGGVGSIPTGPDQPLSHALPSGCGCGGNAS